MFFKRALQVCTRTWSAFRGASIERRESAKIRPFTAEKEKGADAEGDFMHIAIRFLLTKYLGSKNYPESELVEFDELVEELGRWGGGFTQYLLDQERRLSLNTWRVLAANRLHNWSEEAWRLPDQLEPIIDLFFEKTADPEDLIEIKAIFGVLAAMGQIEFENRQSASGKLGVSLATIGEGIESSDPQNAYDFAAFAMACFNGSSERLTTAEEEKCATTVQLHTRLAIVGKKLEQLAAARHEALRQAIRCSKEDTSFQRDAFRAAEQLVETIIALPEGPVREALAISIQQEFDQFDWLRPAGLNLSIALNNTKRQHFIRQSGVDPLVQRVRRFSDAHEKVQYLSSLAEGAGMLLSVIEQERSALSPKTKPMALSVDWTDWRIDHHAYRQAIPQGKSVLRERDFAENIAYYVHETTHVLTLSRHLGLYLYTFKSWIWALELFMEIHPQSDGDQLFERELPPGDAKLLPYIQHQIEIIQRMRIVQDVWVPWFEGLAVYAESAVIPSDDPVGVSVVFEALRGLVDVNPQEGQDVRKAFEEQHMEFEDRASEALISEGHRRLYELFFNNESAPIYGTGYAAVRRIAAEVRANSGRDMTGAEVFAVLLNATQFGLLEYLPDPDVPIDEFEARCRQQMCNWASNLSRLSAEDIALIAHLPAKDAKGALITWKKGKPTAATDTLEQQEKRMYKFWDVMSQKIVRVGNLEVTPPSTLACESNEQEVSLRAECEEFLSIAGLDEQFKNELREFQLNSAVTSFLLPVGNVECNFLTVDTAEPDHAAHIFVPLVTTLAHVDTGKASINALVLPIEKNDFLQIKSIHDRLKDPLLRVSRLIDLAGVGTGIFSQPMHYIVLQYHEWSQAFPAILSIESPEWKERRESFLSKATQRLGNPTGDDFHVPLGQLTERISNWLDSGWVWKIDDEFVSIDEWEVRLKAQVNSLRNHKTQRNRIERAGKALLSTVGISEGLAKTLSEGGFEKATEKTTHIRYDFVEYALATARRPDASGAPPKLPRELNELFCKRKAGWDF